MKKLSKTIIKTSLLSVIFLFFHGQEIFAQWDESQSRIIHTSDRVGIGTSQPDPVSKLHINGGVKIGNNSLLPTNRWSNHVMSLSPVGILGTQGSYGLSMAWNGYRRVDPAGGSWGGWEVAGTGPNSSFRNVGSFEINNGGMFWNYDENPDNGFTPTLRMSIGTDGIVNVEDGLRVGNASLPTNRWAKRVIALEHAGILGSQGTYGISLAWNGYRSTTDGKWSIIGTGPNNTMKNVGSIEMKNTGIFFHFDKNPEDGFVPTPRLSIDTDGVVNAKGALRVGSTTLPDNRWAKSVIGVGPVGIIGSQGSYGLSLAWNGYRSSTDGKWSAIGTGVNNAISNVGSMEMKESGIFFNFDTDPSGEFTPTPRMTIGSNGNVGIGISPQSGFKLAVDGKLIAEELQVRLSENWPDYVFEDDYELMPLEEVKAHIGFREAFTRYS